MSQRVIFDTNFLTYFSDSNGSFAFKPADDTDTLEDRFDNLLEKLSEAGAEIIIPAPVLAEVLSAKHVNDDAIIEMISNSENIIISPFDSRQSIEFGYLFRNFKKSSEDSRNAFKFDLLILACAKVNAVSEIYTADKRLKCKAEGMGIRAYSFQDLGRGFADRSKKLVNGDLFESLP